MLQDVEAGPPPRDRPADQGFRQLGQLTPDADAGHRSSALSPSCRCSTHGCTRGGAMADPGGHVEVSWRAGRPGPPALRRAEEAAPGSGHRRERIWAASPGSCTTFAPRNRELLAVPTAQAQSTTGTERTQTGPTAAYRSVPASRSATSSRPATPFAIDTRRGPRDRRRRRPAARGADPERPLRAQRGQRPVGLALRRAATAPTRWATWRPRVRYDPAPRRAG